MRRIVHFLAFIALVPLVNTPAHAESALADCNSNDVEMIISGCSAVIDESSLSGSTLAIAYSRRSDAYVAQSKLDEAIADRAKAHELDPDNEGFERRLLEAYELRGDANLVTKKHEAAVTDYSTAIDGGLVSAELLQKRSEAYLGAEDIGNAIADLEAALGLVTEKDALIERIALLHELKGARARKDSDLDKAITSYRAALERIESLGAECAKDENAEQGEASANCAARKRLEDALVTTLIDRARERQRRGDEKAAVEDLGHALAMDRKNVDALVLHAIVSEKSNNFGTARTMYRQALRADPGNAEAREGIERLDERERNIARALQIELKRVGCDPGPVDGAWGPKSQAALNQFTNEFAPAIDNNRIKVDPDSIPAAVMDEIERGADTFSVQSAIDILSAIEGKVCAPLYVGTWDCDYAGEVTFGENYEINNGTRYSFKLLEKAGSDFLLEFAPPNGRVSLFDVTENSMIYHHVESGDTSECRRR